MNKKGFISAYALLLLQLFMIFLLLLTQTCTTFASIHKHQEQELIDVAILHSIKEKLKENVEYLDKEDTVGKEEDIEEGSDTSQANEWELEYEGILVNFHMQDDEILIDYDLKGRNVQCKAELDETQTHLINYEYL